MIRTVIRADKRNISIKVPEDYVGKEVEIIAFAIDEVDSPTDPDRVLTHLATERVLAKDWLSAEEDKAWQDL